MTFSLTGGVSLKAFAYYLFIRITRNRIPRVVQSFPQIAVASTLDLVLHRSLLALSGGSYDIPCFTFLFYSVLC
jgi:hypothetical protein